MKKIKRLSRKLLPYFIRGFILRSIGYMEFKICLLSNKPYFGTYLTAGQTWPQRRIAMRNLLESELSKYKGNDYQVLEVGSWGGQSAILWASICKKFKKGKVFCVDTWGSFENKLFKVMKKATKGDKIMKLFFHNVKATNSNNITAIRGRSNDVAKILKPNSFNFVYVDGDHTYHPFKKDLEDYSKLCCQGGIICGDDLELDPSEVDLDNARKNQRVDYIKDTKTGEYFHPGIALAVKEFFGKVSMLNGFWAVRKSKNGWEKVILSCKR